MIVSMWWFFFSARTMYFSRGFLRHRSKMTAAGIRRSLSISNKKLFSVIQGKNHRNYRKSYYGPFKSYSKYGTGIKEVN
jgi:hypothetical protein